MECVYCKILKCSELYNLLWTCKSINYIDKFLLIHEAYNWLHYPYFHIWTLVYVSILIVNIIVLLSLQKDKKKKLKLQKSSNYMHYCIKIINLLELFPFSTSVLNFFKWLESNICCTKSIFYAKPVFYKMKKLS